MATYCKKEEQKRYNKENNKHRPHNSSGASNGRHSLSSTSMFISEWNNLKQESDRKIVQKFFISGIQQYYQDKLEKRLSLTPENSKIVYVSETEPELIISDGEALIHSKIDINTRKGTDFDMKKLKGKFLKLNDWNYIVKMESILSKNKDFAKILLNIKKYQLMNDFSLKLSKNIKLQDFIYENESIMNLIRYTKHKICKSTAASLSPDEIAIPTIADLIGNKDNWKFKPIIKVQHKNLCKTVTKITNFKLPSQNDIEDILGTLPPLNYKNVWEVELEEELSEEVKS